MEMGDGSVQRENETGVVIFARQSASLVCVLISSFARPHNPFSLRRLLSPKSAKLPRTPTSETVTTSKFNGQPMHVFTLVNAQLP